MAKATNFWLVLFERFFFAVFKPHIFVFKFSILNSRVMTDMEVATQAKYGMIIIEGNLAKFHLHFSFF